MSVAKVESRCVVSDNSDIVFDVPLAVLEMENKTFPGVSPTLEIAVN
jgi:hypothetical protein